MLLSDWSLGCKKHWGTSTLAGRHSTDVPSSFIPDPDMCDQTWPTLMFILTSVLSCVCILYLAALNVKTSGAAFSIWKPFPLSWVQARVMP